MKGKIVSTAPVGIPFKDGGSLASIKILDKNNFRLLFYFRKVRKKIIKEVKK